jgi:hypothetical protein
MFVANDVSISTELTGIAPADETSSAAAVRADSSVALQPNHRALIQNLYVHQAGFRLFGSLLTRTMFSSFAFSAISVILLLIQRLLFATSS